jgi:hypothetical protein
METRRAKTGQLSSIHPGSTKPQPDQREVSRRALEGTMLVQEVASMGRTHPFRLPRPNKRSWHAMGRMAAAAGSRRSTALAEAGYQFWQFRRRDQPSFEVRRTRYEELGSRS